MGIQFQRPAGHLIGPLLCNWTWQDIVIGIAPNENGRSCIGSEGVGKSWIECFSLRIEIESLAKLRPDTAACCLLATEILVVGFKVGGWQPCQDLRFR